MDSGRGSDGHRIPEGGAKRGLVWESFGKLGFGKRKHHLFHRACSLITVPSLTLGEIIQTNCPWNKSNCICKHLSSFRVCAKGYIVA